jgi:outer membrane lipoprotein-sorting protein
MFRRSTVAFVAAFLLPVALSLAACGGGTTTATPSPDANATPTAAAATEAATTAPDATATGEAPSAAASLGAIPSFDLSGLTEHLANVDSYRTSFVVDGVEKYSSIVITKPEIRRQITFVDGGQTTTIVVIGDKSWVKSGDQTAFQAIPTELSTAMLAAFDPSLIVGAFSQIDWGHAAVDQGAEQKNGVSTHHYTIDPTSLTGTLAMPAGASIDTWIADEGYLVAWESTGFAGAQNVSIQVTNVDDPANVVEEPS